jgi:N-acylneuraminate cytidylyltransferase
MTSDCTNVAIIPARRGSKGLPKKNILPFCGKPLIAWTIEQAIAAKNINRVIVSTDCEEIADVAQSYGAHVQGLRPADISTDTSTTEEVVFHECLKIRNANIFPKNIILLQCTSPIRLPGTIDRAIQEFRETPCKSLVSVAESHRFFWYRSNVPVATYNYEARPRRQDLKLEQIPYMETGSIYITDFELFMQKRNRLLGEIYLFETDKYESFEIDDADDFELCEYLAKKVLIHDNQ